MGMLSPRSACKNPNESTRLIITTFVGVVFGFLIGLSFHTLSLSKLYVPSSFLPSINASLVEETASNQTQNINTTSGIWAPTNPRGAERLPPGIVAAESDLYLHRLWGNPEEDITIQQKYLVTFTVGYGQRANIDRAVKKFSDNFTILLFHYDGRTTEWDEFEWSKRAIHVSVHKQAKWWYAKRFLHPDIVAPYDYIFIWDEDLEVENFDAEKYIEIVKKHGLEISQPGLEPRNRSSITWEMTKKQANHEVHKKVENNSRCSENPLLPPCAAFVEIMAPVFSREAWRCFWHLIQNDLVHGWGLDFALRRCVEPAHEKIGVVDAQWIVHQSLPSLGNQGEARDGKAAWEGVRERCGNEWTMLRNRLANAEKSYFKSTFIANSEPSLEEEASGVDRALGSATRRHQLGTRRPVGHAAAASSPFSLPIKRSLPCLSAISIGVPQKDL